jgi:hypothetical protein
MTRGTARVLPLRIAAAARRPLEIEVGPAGHGTAATAPSSALAFAVRAASVTAASENATRAPCMCTDAMRT